jgi:hypothetical protein
MSQHRSAAKSLMTFFNQRRMEGGLRSYEQRDEVLKHYNNQVKSICECDEETEQPDAQTTQHCLHCTRRQTKNSTK